MKKHILFLLVIIITSSACNKLKDVQINNNPYDKNYEGPQVVSILSITHTHLTNPVIDYNTISVKPTIARYESVSLYRDGVIIGGGPKTSFPPNESGLLEVYTDYAAVSGITYNYQVQLHYETSSTLLSQPLNYTTP